MKCRQKPGLIFLILCFCNMHTAAQYILNGSAQKNSCNCYTLTPNTTFQSGSVWNSQKINLTKPFDFIFNVNLGCDDAGADGIVFILQPISTSIGTVGQGMGFGGVSPSIGIALDTYQNSNLNDPTYDHISIQANGVIDHANDLAGPVAILPGGFNVEDCQFHKFRITWDPSDRWIRTYFDGTLRLEKQIDLINDIFFGKPELYWGFTGATGGQVNIQQFCTALDPAFTTDAVNNTACEGRTVTFTDKSESFTAIQTYNWGFGDGSTSTLMSPLPHPYAKAGNYGVSLTITGQDGCEATTTLPITVGSLPSAAFAVTDTCLGYVPNLQFTAQNFGVDYLWKLDGVAGPVNLRPQLANLATGRHRLDVLVSSVANCGPDAVANNTFVIKPAPVIEALTQNGCAGQALDFTGAQKDNLSTVATWRWSFGDGEMATGQNAKHAYKDPKIYNIELQALATNGCSSLPATALVSINKAFVFAGNDTVLIRNRPAQLQVSGNGSFHWSPVLGLSDADVANPLATLNNDQEYTVKVTTAEGCTAEDKINIKVYAGPAVYVPNAFTPNGDGKNETLKPVYAGIKSLKDFSIFNRWGQLLFRTDNMQKAWSGTGLNGTFVWYVEAVDEESKPVLMKGTVTIIR